MVLHKMFVIAKCFSAFHLGGILISSKQCQDFLNLKFHLQHEIEAQAPAAWNLLQC